MKADATDRWEALPEFRATRTYVRCVDRLFQSLPHRVRWRMLQPTLTAAVSIGTGIACFHGRYDLARRVTPDEREGHRQRALDGIRVSIEGLDEIATVRGADRAELLVARELLDRIEGSLRAAGPAPQHR